MARIRTIKPKFWDDSKLSKVSRDARLVFIGLWNFADDNGVVNADPVWLKSKIFPYDNIQIQQFQRWLLELSKLGFISPFSHNEEGFYYLPNLLKHQVINRPNKDDVFVPKSALDKALEESRNNHRLISDGKERKGKEGKGKDEGEAHTLRTTEQVEFDKVVAWIKEKAPRVLEMKEPLKQEEYFKLKEKYGAEKLPKIFMAMHNWSKLTKERVNPYLTFIAFAKRDKDAA